MVSFVYNVAKTGFADGTEDWDDTSKSYVITLVSSYTEDPDHTRASQFSGHELAGSNHTSGYGGTMRKPIASPTVTQNDTDDQAELSGTNVTWTAIDGGQACAAIVVRESGGSINSNGLAVLIAYIDDGFGIVTNGGDFTISWAGSGIIKLASNA
jgi:hypothetical protein